MDMSEISEIQHLQQEEYLEQKRYKRWAKKQRQKKLILNLKEILAEVSKGPQSVKMHGVSWRSDNRGFVIQDKKIFQTFTLPKFYDFSNPRIWTVTSFYNKLLHFPFQQMFDYQNKRSFRHQDLDNYNLQKKTLSDKQKKRKPKVPKNTQKNATYTVNRTKKTKKTQQQQSQSSSQQASSDYMQEQSVINKTDQQLAEQIIRLRQQDEKLDAQIYFCKEIRRNPQLKVEDVIIRQEKSRYFRSVFYKNLQQYNIKKLGKLIRKVNSPKIIRRRLPYTMYINEQNTLHPEKISCQNVSQEIILNENKTNFSEGALHLIHDDHPVDINEFFKYDWSRFEVMSLNNCGLRTGDWVKMSRNALEMLPNLKLLQLNGNQIQVIRKNDLLKFSLIKKFELKRNKLHAGCEKEFQSYLKDIKDGMIRSDF